MKADHFDPHVWDKPRRPQAASPRLLKIEAESAAWAERVEAALGGLVIFLGFIVIVVAFSVLGVR